MNYVRIDLWYEYLFMITVFPQLEPPRHSPEIILIPQTFETHSKFGGLNNSTPRVLITMVHNS